MIDWLTRHRVPHDQKMLKAELLTLVKLQNPTPVYQTDVLAAKFDMSCVRLPVGHCELNPIELVWAHVKGYAARNSTGASGFTMENIKRLCHEGIQRVTPDK